MSLVSLSLVVLAAFIHATWNLLSKRAADAGAAFVFASNVIALVLYLPWVGWVLAHNAPSWSLPVAGCLVLSAILHLAYNLCLQRGYQVADLSVVYPTARGTARCCPPLAPSSCFVKRLRPRASSDCSRSSPGSASSPPREISPRSGGRAGSTGCAGAPPRAR